jgi:hypothetical protein
MAKVSLDPSRQKKLEQVLIATAGPAPGDSGVRVECNTPGKYPVLIDGEDSGRICPSGRIPLPRGAHKVSVYMPETSELLTKDVVLGDSVKNFKFRP